MVVNTAYPSTFYPYLVQINWDKDTGFYLAKNFQDVLDSYAFYNIVAIFKCKPKLKP